MTVMISKQINLIIAFTGLINVNYTKSNAQSIVGKWQNTNKNRVVQIVENDGNIEGILIHSQQENDSIGRLIITKCSEHNGYYNGLINSFDGTIQRRAKIKYNANEPGRLYITIPRMLFFNVKLQWERSREE